MAKAGSIFINTRLGTAQLSADIAKAKKRLSRAARDFQSIGFSMTKAVTLPAAAVGTLAVKSFADFDDAMTKSLAIMGNVSDAMKKDMVSAARAVSTQTTFSSKQAAESFFFLASAGLDAKQSIAALPQVAKFAQAGTFDMALATDLLTDAQSALGLTVKDVTQNQENMIRVSDVLVKANNIANASVQQFSEALTGQAGPALKGVGKDIEEGVAVLAAFADQGIKGADASTKFAIVMRDLQTKAITNKEAFKEIGISVFDANEKMRNLGEIIANVESALSGMSDETKKATLLQLGFADKSISAIQALLGTSEKIKGYEKTLRSAGGVTEEVANKQLTSLTSKLKLLRNAFENAFITIGDTFNSTVGTETLGFFRGLAQLLQETASGFQALDPSTQRAALSFIGISAAIGPVLIVLSGLAAVLGGPATLAITGIVVLVGGATAAWVKWGDKVKQLIVDFNNFLDSLDKATQELRNYVVENARAALGLDRLSDSAKKAIAEIKKQALAEEENARVIEKQGKALQKWLKEVGGFKGATDKVKDFVGKFIDLENVSDKVKDGIKKVADVLGPKQGALSAASKQASDAVKLLNESLQRAKFDIESTKINQAIEAALKNGNKADLNVWLERLREHTEKGVFDGAKDALEKAGEAGRAIVAEQAKLESDLKVDEILGRQQEALKAQHEKAVDSWASLMEDAISGTRFNFEEQFKKAAVRIAATFLASLDFNNIAGSFTGALNAAGGAVTPGNLSNLSGLGNLVSSFFGGGATGAPGVPQVISINGAPPVPATGGGMLSGLTSAGAAAGAYVGYQQFQGANSYFRGENQSFLEQLALAPLTGGLSFLSNAFNPFGSGKDRETQIRDEIREVLRQTGLGENLSFAGVGGSFSFAEERDVGPGQTSAFKDQLMAFAEPFAALLGGGGKVDFASILANAAGGALGPVENLTEALFNLTSILDTAGLSAQQAKNDLTAAFLAGDITAGKFGESLQNLNLIANDSFGSIQDRINILANEMAEGGAPQTQLRALESAFRHAASTGLEQFSAVRDEIVNRFGPDSANVFNELRNIGVDSFESFANLSADQIFALFDIVNRFSSGMAKSLKMGSAAGAQAVIENLKQIEREASRVNDIINASGSVSSPSPSISTNLVTTLPSGVKSSVYNIDARGAGAGVEQKIVAAIAQAENRAVMRSVNAMEARSRRL